MYWLQKTKLGVMFVLKDELQFVLPLHHEDGSTRNK